MPLYGQILKLNVPEKVVFRGSLRKRKKSYAKPIEAVLAA